MQPLQHISIPNPCPASWNEMTPNNNGRHCLHCAKTVVDFSVMTDAEVIGYITNSGKACGSFNEHQLNRINHLLQPKAKHGFSWKGLAAAVSLLILSPEVKAEAKTTFKTEQGTSVFKLPLQINAADSTHTITIKGKVIAKDDSLALPGVSIAIKGTQSGTQTSVEGGFRISTNMPNPILVISYIGYKTQEIAVSQLTGDLKISMESQGMMLGEYVIVKRAPFYKRWFYKVKRLF